MAEDTGLKITDMVRNLAAASGFIRKPQAMDSLGLTVTQADAAIRTLKEQGFLKRVGHGTYEYRHKPMDGNESPVEDKVWRAMRLSPTFSASELSRIAGTTTNYIHKLLRKYRSEGILVAAGQQTALSGSHEKLWRLTPKGKKQQVRPRLKTFKPDPIVIAVVALNKLVCTGMAARFEEENRKALKLCREIMEGLSGLIREKGENHETE